MTVRAYCVQPFFTAGRGVDAARVLHFGTMDEALEAARHLSGNYAGVAVYEFTGEVRSGVWSDPRLLETHGRVKPA